MNRLKNMERQIVRRMVLRLALPLLGCGSSWGERYELAHMERRVARRMVLRLALPLLGCCNMVNGRGKVNGERPKLTCAENFSIQSVTAHASNKA